ncbi:MAG: hypothetical protein LBQ52_01895 [Helicobacteraceae bacterium]|jgi:hypothetical protein|nr:hypothetical protein [Helicobacteraceae bacterium]
MYNYAIATDRFLNDKKLTPSEKLLSGLIFGEIIEKGEFSLSNKMIAQMLMTSENSVKSILKRLYAKELIINAGNRRNRAIIFTENAIEQSVKLTLLKCQNDTSETNSHIIETQAPAQLNILNNLNTPIQEDLLFEGVKGELFNFAFSRQENKTLFESVYKIYPKKTTKQLAIKKWNIKKLWLKADKIKIAIENYKKTEPVARGFVLDFTKFLDRYDDYVDGVPEGVKVSDIQIAPKKSGAAQALAQKLRELGASFERDPKLRERAAKLESKDLRARSGAAFFTAQEARAVEALGGIETAVMSALYGADYETQIAIALEERQ